jgi:hypothetical protein
MKFDKRFIFFLAGLFFVLFVFCSADQEKQEKMDVEKAQREEIIKKMVLAEGMDMEAHKEKMKTLADKIICMNGKVLEHFKKGEKDDIEAIANLYGDNATVIAPDYKKIQGKAEISDFWSSGRENALRIAAEKKAEMALKIKTMSIFLTDAIGEKEIEVEGKKESYDCVAYVISKVKIIIKEGEEKVQNDTFITMQPLMHRTACPWIP